MAFSRTSKAVSKLFAVPISIRYAKLFVLKHHRHNKPPQGALFAVGCSSGDGIIGVAIVGRPVARILQDGFTVEVTRTCVIPGSQKGANSFLYAACWRAARAMGYRRLVTYNLASESGASLRGAGLRVVAKVKGRRKGWSREKRPRGDQPVYYLEKNRWEKSENRAKT